MSRLKGSKNKIHRVISTEPRTCACGCNEIFVCIVNSEQQFKHGHNNRGRKFIRTEEQNKNTSITTKLGMANMAQDDKEYMSQHSIELGRKIGLSNKGRKLSKDHIEKRNATRHKTAEDRGYWHSPETMQYFKSNKHISTILKVVCRHPNSFETNALNYVNAIYDNKVRYTGNGSLIINGKSADAELIGSKTIFLFNGYYWHLKKYGLDVTEENKRAVEKVESAPFLVAGYKVIFIWEDELNEVIKTNFNRNIVKEYSNGI